MKTVLNIILTLVGIGLFIALLRVFNFDVFAVIEWAWNWCVSVVERIADWFSGNKTFQDATKAPSVIAFLNSFGRF